jgi:hypothetical protein
VGHITGSGMSAGSGLSFEGEILYGSLVPGIDDNKDRMAAGALLTVML